MGWGAQFNLLFDKILSSSPPKHRVFPTTYPTAFARLVAHAEEVEDALFYMTNADKRFAIDYYYDNLLKEKGISYTNWLNTLEYFLFYEYCEWVFVGNRHNATDGKYYQKYLPIAKQQAIKLLKNKAK